MVVKIKIRHAVVNEHHDGSYDDLKIILSSFTNNTLERKVDDATNQGITNNSKIKLLN